MESSSSMSNGLQAASSSKSIIELVNGSHESVIRGYSLLKRMPCKAFISEKFQVGGYDWMLRFYPAGEDPKYNSTYVSVYLSLESDVDDVETFVEFTLKDQSEKGNHKVGSFFHSLVSKFRSGYKNFIRRTTLENSGFLKDDCLVISCTLGVVRRHIQNPKIVQIAPPPNMGHSLKQLMESSMGTDIVFEVGGETFKAHKLILAARSPVFKAQFFGLIENKDMDKVLIKEVEPSVFKVMLIFLYSDQLPVSTPTIMVQNLIIVADRFGLDRLRLLCESRLCEEVTTNTVATTLVLAENYCCSHLKSFCLKFLTEPENFGEVVKSEEYEYLKANCPSLVMELLEIIELKYAESILVLSKKKCPSAPKA